MIADLVDGPTLRRVVERFRSNLDWELTALVSRDDVARAAADEAGLTEAETRDAVSRMLALAAQDDAELAGTHAPMVIPRSAVASLIQSTYDEFFDHHQSAVAEQGQGLSGSQTPTTAVALSPDARAFLLGDRDELGGRLTRFAERDVRFLTWGGAAKLVTWFRGGRRPFTTTPPSPVRIHERARVLLVGDWGSGIPRATALADVMHARLEDARQAGREALVIHLGDVYYTGQPSEYDRRFLAHWPVRPGEAERFGSWCLNGNHDMYSGGYAYFDHLLKDPRFARQQQSSVFAIESDHWQLLGLDSAYTEAELHGDQTNWIRRMREAAPAKKAFLLSHHQPFSHWEPDSVRLSEQVEPILKAGLITGWFWGHEHRCAIYEPRNNIRYPRLAGDGGVPVWAASEPTPAGVRYEHRESFTAFLDEQFARFGFVQLDLDGPRIDVTYVNELGQTHYAEEMV